MSLGLKKFWLWTKLAAIVLVVAWVTLFFAFNRNHKANVWVFFGVETAEPISLDVILPITALASIIVFYVVRKVVSVLAEIGKLRQAEQAQAREQRMKDLARQMEEKLKTSSSSGPPKAGE